MQVKLSLGQLALDFLKLTEISDEETRVDHVEGCVNLRKKTAKVIRFYAGKRLLGQSAQRVE
jgi:hypothetical protein